MRRYFSMKAIHAVLWTLFLFAVGLFVWNLLSGPSRIDVFAVRVLELDVSVALRIDSLSTLLFGMITLLGAAIARFAIRFLDGEERQLYFFQNLLLTVLAVSLFVLSSNLLMLFAMWLASSYGIHRLLLFYQDRPAALYAARKKILISRAGDLALLGGIVLTYQVFGTFEFAEIFAEMEHVTADSERGRLLSLGGFFFAAGAMAKSAQYPFHFWLPETMETPTPVSALMHAGIINAGGFLIIRLSPMLQHAEAAHLLLAVVGAVTAVFGALSMITQTDIKKKLAYSTISQMGMMLFACGLGAYTIALFHIFAHSFYKAYAFLSTGTLVQEARKVGFHITRPSTAWLALVSAAGAALVGAGLYVQDGVYFALATYGAVLFMGLFQNAGQSADGPFARLRVYPTVAAGMALAILVYAGIEYGMERYLHELVPVVWTSATWHSPQGLVSMFTFAIFVVGFWLSAALMRPKGDFMQRLYVYFWNGGYLSQSTTRLIQRIAPIRQ